MALPQRAIVKEHLAREGKFIVEFLNGGEELMNYNDLINIYNARDEEGAALWSFDKITRPPADQERQMGSQNSLGYWR